MESRPSGGGRYSAITTPPPSTVLQQQRQEQEACHTIRNGHSELVCTVSAQRSNTAATAVVEDTEEDALALTHSFSDRIVWNIVYENEHLLAAKETAQQELAALRAEIAHYRSVVEKLQRLCPPNSFPPCAGGETPASAADHASGDVVGAVRRETDGVADEESPIEDDELLLSHRPQSAGQDTSAVLRSAVANLVDTMERFEPNSLASCLQDLPHALSSISLQLAHIRGLVAASSSSSAVETEKGQKGLNLVVSGLPSVHQLWLSALDKMTDLIAWVTPHARSTALSSSSSSSTATNAFSVRSRSGSLSSAPALRNGSSKGGGIAVGAEGSDLHRTPTTAAFVRAGAAHSAGEMDADVRFLSDPPTASQQRIGDPIGVVGAATRKRERSQEWAEGRAAPPRHHHHHQLYHNSSSHSNGFSTPTPPAPPSSSATVANSRERKLVPQQSVQQPLLATLARTSWSPRPSVKSLTAEFPLPAPPPPSPPEFLPQPRSTSPARLVRRRPGIGAAPQPTTAPPRSSSSSAWNDGSVASSALVPPLSSAAAGTLAGMVPLPQRKMLRDDAPPPPLREIERNTPPKTNKLELHGATSAAAPPQQQQRAAGGRANPPTSNPAMSSSRFLLDSPPQGRTEEPLIQF